MVLNGLNKNSKISASITIWLSPWNMLANPIIKIKVETTLNNAVLKLNMKAKKAMSKLNTNLIGNKIILIIHLVHTPKN